MEANRPEIREFAVRSHGRWFLTPVGSSRPIEATLAEVVARCEEGPPGSPLPPVGDDRFGERARLTPERWLWSVPRLIGEVTRGGLVIESPGCGHVLLDRTDLCVLEALGDGGSVADISRGAGVDDAGPRLERLVAAGAVRVPGTTGPGAGASTAEAPPPPITSVPGRAGAHPGGRPGRVPVYSVWSTVTGPMLSLGMLTAAARAHDGGALNEHFEIRHPEDATSFLEDLRTRRGPAVLLSSDYVFSLEHNLDLARQAKRINPELVVVHGGPSSPRQPDDARRFLHEHREVAHVLTRGEGERLICELLGALVDTLPALDPEALARIDGLSFIDERTGDVVRTADRERSATLDEFPSPYLTGEYDHIPASAWRICLSIETNRGCPYGCTFCDWGSATLSRIRKFDAERVVEEVRWAAERGISAVNLVDANFGIMARDVEITRRIGAIKSMLGYPEVLVFAPAKNTTKHLTAIFDALAEAGIHPGASLSVQTTDPATLEVLDRSNIATDHFVALAADLRRRGHAVLGDLLLGVPNQTHETFKADLQFMADHEICVRTHPLQGLPNAPMAEPDYRERHRIEVEDGMVVATATYSRRDRAEMLKLRDLDLIFERYGLLRHVLRWLQWDHGILSHDVLDHLRVVTGTSPERFPHLSWLAGYFDLHPGAPCGWTHVYREARALLVEDFGIDASSGLDCVLELQRFLMPERGRTFPATIALDHAYQDYYADAVRGLYTHGHAGSPPAPLVDYPPSDFTVTADPLGLCENGLWFAGEPRSETFPGDFENGAGAANELLSPLMRVLPWVRAAGVRPVFPTPSDLAAWQAAPVEDVVEPSGRVGRLTPVTVSSRT